MRESTQPTNKKRKLAYMEIGNRIKQRRKELKLTQAELAKSVGVARVSVTQWETGITSPKGANLIKLASTLGVEPDWFIKGGEIPKPKTANATMVGGFETWDSKTPIGADEVEVPFFTDVNLSAGAGTAEVLEFRGPKLRFARSTLKRQGVQPEHAACARVDGNSMEPVLPHGSTVGIDTNQTEVQDGKMYAIDHDGLLRIKVLYRLPRGGLRLRSFNQDEWPDEQVQPEEIEQIRILGKVFWYSVLL